MHKNTLAIVEKETAVLDRIDRAEKAGAPFTMQVLRQRLANSFSERDLRRIVKRLGDSKRIHARGYRHRSGKTNATLHVGAPQ
jgi:hypothetical protein